MRLAIAVLFVFAISAAALAEDGIPSRKTLADMGLSGMRIISDHEGLAIRGFGTGAKGREPSDKMLWYQQGITDLRTHEAEFKDRLANHMSAKADWYHTARSNYRDSVAKFHSRLGE
jgi:hypothetical protein